MIGNDIIDLKLAKFQSNWQRFGFLQKLFIEKEQEIILKSEDAEMTVWLLWSMKEAVYKAVQRKYSMDRFYNPKRFFCSHLIISNKSARGVVCFENEIFKTSSRLSLTKIYTCTSNTEFSLILKTQNSRISLLHKIAEQKNIPLETLNISKNKQGIPFLTYKGDNLQIPFSLSHHGDFSAYALSLNLS